MSSSDPRILFEVGLDDDRLHTFAVSTVADVEAIVTAVQAFTLAEGHGLLFGAAELFLRPWDKIRSVGVVVAHPGTPEPIYKMMPALVPSGRTVNLLNAPVVVIELGLVDGNVRIFDDMPTAVIREVIGALVTGGAEVAWNGAPAGFSWSPQEIRFLRIVRKIAREDPPAMIPDPAGRLTEKLHEQLYDRYVENADGVSQEKLFDFDRRFANACDLAVQLLWAEKYGTTPTDPNLQTSNPARQIAHLFAMAFGITGDDEDEG